MTEAEAISEIVEHLNSGKKLILWGPDRLPLPNRRGHFLWWDRDARREVVVNHPVTAFRESTREEFMFNHPFPEENQPEWPSYFYEYAID